MDFNENSLSRNLTISEIMHIQAQITMLTRKCNAKWKEHALLQTKIIALEKQCTLSKSFSIKITQEYYKKYANLKTIIKKQGEDQHHNITLTTATVLQECYRLKEQIDAIQLQITVLQPQIRPSKLVRLPPIS